MSNFICFKVFPKLGQSNQSLSGGIKFIFQNKECYLVSDGKYFDLEQIKGAGSKKTQPNYQQLYLYILNNGNQFSEFELIEKIVDILSLATNSHLSLFSPVLVEYDYIPGWSVGSFEENEHDFNGLKYDGSENFFIKNDFLIDLIEKISRSSFKERIFGSIHLNRLSKYKFSTHLTESLADNVFAMEALYMYYDGKRSNNLDSDIIGEDNKNQSTAVAYFINKYYPFESENDKKLVNGTLNRLDPYDKRSKYLHNGLMILPPRAVSQLFNTEKGAFEFDIYNLFQRIVFYTILNFINKIK